MIEKNFQIYNSHLEGSIVQLSANQNFIATLGSDDIIFTIDNVLKQTNTLQLKNQQKLEITAFAIHPIVQNCFVFGTSTGIVKFMRPINNLQLNKAQIIFQSMNGAPITSLSFSSSGKYLGIANEVISLLYCMKSKKTLKLMNQHQGFVNRIDFGNDQYIYSIGNEGNLHLYSIKNQEKKQNDEEISDDPFQQVNSSIQVSFMDKYKLAVQQITRKYSYLNASFCTLQTSLTSQNVIFCSGNTSLQTIEITKEQSHYNIVRQVKQNTQILLVMPLNKGGNEKVITLAVNTAQILSIWNYSHLQKVFQINLLEELNKLITCLIPVSTSTNPSFAFIVNNKDSDGKIYQFTNESVLNISQNKVNQPITNTIEEQKQKDQDEQSQVIEEITPTKRLITAYPQFPLEKGYEEYNRARFMFYNNTGCIIQRTEDTNSVMELQIHDKSRMRRMKLPKNKTFGLFSLKQKIFVCANSREIIFQQEKQLKQGLSPWTILWQEIQGIAIGGNWLAAINNQEIRVFDYLGNEIHTLSFDRRFVAMQAYEDLLAVVYHGNLPAYGYQQLKVKIYKVTANSIILDRDVIMPLKAKSILKWFGFSQQGMMVCHDSLEIVRCYSFNRNEWQTVFSLEGKDQSLFIQHIQCSDIYGFLLPHKRNQREQPKVLPRSLPTKVPMVWPDLKLQQLLSQDEQKYLKKSMLKNFMILHQEYRHQNWYKIKYSRRRDHPWYEQSKTIKSQQDIKTLKFQTDLQIYDYIRKYLSKTQLKGDKYKHMIGSLLLICQKEINFQESRQNLKQLLLKGYNGAYISKQTVQNIQDNLAFRPFVQNPRSKDKINEISVLQQILSLDQVDL